MKKIVLVSLLLICTLVLSSCTLGNQQIGLDMERTFTWAILDLGNGELIEGRVTSWRDFDKSDAVQFTLDDGVTYLTHYSKVILCTERP